MKSRTNFVIRAVLVLMLCVSVLTSCTAQQLRQMEWMNEYLSEGSTSGLIFIMRGTRSNSLISNVSVRITGRYNNVEKYGKTGSNGKVTFLNVPAGTYEVAFSRYGGPTWYSQIQYSGGSKRFELKV